MISRKIRNSRKMKSARWTASATLRTAELLLKYVGCGRGLPRGYVPIHAGRSHDRVTTG
jgi:hypothetical protein